MIFIMSVNLERHLRHLRAQTLVFGPSQYLFHLGDPIRVIHFVRTGLVHLTRLQSKGSALVLQQAGAGAIVAEASLRKLNLMQAPPQTGRRSKTPYSPQGR
jgi:CRP-like cAMP-binding protein